MMKPVILLVEDDAEDKELMEQACGQAGISIPLYSLADGEKLLDFLLKRNEFSQRDETLHPVLIFMDLNMPRGGGQKALVEIKSDECWKATPVIIFTTSATKEEAFQTYAAGANSLILKPFSFQALVEIMRAIRQYWCETVELP